VLPRTKESSSSRDPAPTDKKMEITMADDKHVSIEAHGETLVEATISPADGDGEVRVDVHTESGHLPVGARQRMADAIHEVVTDDQASRMSATVPLGDAELVEGIRGHLNNVELRAAGATSIIEGTVDSS
jgi:hypothetical protein